ncbi:MAG: hypothetical protein KDA28_08480, partial [Phycisphaerales bacterium]|nr:hypothetical protein [Phycisphaerales bacterium]
LAERSTGAFLSEARRLEIFGSEASGPHPLIAFWRHIPEILIGTFMTSYAFCAGTLLYLTLRKVNDNQELDEIFTDGLY